MLVIKWSEAVRGSGYDIYTPLCSVSYNKKDEYLVPWPGTDSYYNMNFLLSQKNRTTGFSQGDSIRINSKTGKIFSIIFGSVDRPSMRRDKKEKT